MVRYSYPARRKTRMDWPRSRTSTSSVKVVLSLVSRLGFEKPGLLLAVFNGSESGDNSARPFVPERAAWWRFV